MSTRMIDRAGSKSAARALVRLVESIGLVSVTLLCLFLAQPTSGSQTKSEPLAEQLPAGKGRDLVAANCGLCHSLERVISVKRAKGDWQRLVTQMWERRAPFSETDVPTLVDYLYTNFGRPDLPPRSIQTVALPPQYASYDFSQPAKRGTLAGVVVADKGPVHAFSVTAHNLLYRIRYQVFTKDGRYTLPQALPGPYEISGTEYGYSSSTEKVDLKPGDSVTANLSVTKDPPPSDVAYVDFDTVYPPGPGHDLYVDHCVGCHEVSPHWKMQLTEYGYRMGVEYMRWGQILGGLKDGETEFSNTQFSTAEMDAIGHYLGSVLNPNVKRVMRRPDYPTDENVTSKAIFVQYELPDEQIRAHGGNIGFHDAFMAADGSAWYGSGAGNGVMIRLDPKEQDPNKRMKFYDPSPGQKFGVNGIAEDRLRHHVYFSDLSFGRIGEVDPESGSVSLHVLPNRGGIHSMYGDSKGNIWYANLYGGQIGKYDPTTGHAWTYPTLTPDIGPYGVTEDQKGDIWIAGINKSMVAKFDPETQTMKEYKAPTLGAGVRRIRADSNGIIWFSESSTASFGKLDPKTGEITEYKLPIANISPYSLWIDRKDEKIVWGSDLVNDYGYSPFSFDTRTRKMVYYPAPRGTWAPETFTEQNNTVWLVQRKSGNVESGQIHFYPAGYTADAPPEP